MAKVLIATRNFKVSIAFILLINAFVFAQKTTVVPVELNAPIVNPYMGWGAWIGNHGFGGSELDFTVKQNTIDFANSDTLFSWLMLDWDWASLEPQEGVFNWTQFDSVITYWGTKYKQIIFRPWVTDDAGWNGRPGAAVCPQWLWVKGLKSKSYTGPGGNLVKAPDYLDTTFKTIYLPALKKFLFAFATRYDKSGTPIIYIQTQGYGTWADNATWFSTVKFPSVEIKHQLLWSIIKMYRENFKVIKLFQFGGGDWEQYGTLQERLHSKALDSALMKIPNFGLMWTGFPDGLNGMDQQQVNLYWKTNPIIAESNYLYDDMKNQGQGNFAVQYSQMQNYHTYFSHFYMTATSWNRAIKEDRTYFENGLKNGGIGYRLVPTRFSWSTETPVKGNFLLEQTWVNRNVARCYIRQFLKVSFCEQVSGTEKFSFIDSNFNATNWIVSNSYQVTSGSVLPGTLSQGIYDLFIGLIDSATAVPSIRIPIQGENKNLLYKIGTIKIVQPVSVRERKFSIQNDNNSHKGENLKEYTLQGKAVNLKKIWSKILNRRNVN